MIMGVKMNLTKIRKIAGKKKLYITDFVYDTVYSFNVSGYGYSHPIAKFFYRAPDKNLVPCSRSMALKNLKIFIDNY